VAPGDEAKTLAPFALERLPLDAEILQRLDMLGVKTIGEFAALPRRSILVQFGREGQRWYRVAHGRDEATLRPYAMHASETVLHYFDDPIEDQAVLERQLRSLASELFYRVDARGQGAQTIQLRLGLEDETSCDRRRSWFEPIVQEDGLGDAFTALLQQVMVSCGVMSVQLIATDFVPIANAAHQLSLFDWGSTESQLQDLVSRLIRRYGDEPFPAIKVADSDAWLLERRFSLQRRDAP